MRLFFEIFSAVFGAIFLLGYFYQVVYVLVVLLKKGKSYPEAEPKNYGILIAARNESAVIGHLIDSIKNQKYPQDKLKLFVVADNCTDNTAEICREKGATVYERQNKEQIGKGYALDFLLKNIFAANLDENIEAFFVFDADNVLDENFIFEMNKAYSAGNRVITSYRNSKNYGDNWISAGHGLWYVRESKFLNEARMKLGTTCAVSGTGFLFDKNIVKEENGWKYHLLIEDIEFSSDLICSGEKIAYCPTAMLYDEQPTKFGVSWRQRTRWAKGFFQIFRRYAGKLFVNIFKRKSFSCFDMFMTVSPAVLTTVGTLVGVAGFIYALIFPSELLKTVTSLLIGGANVYLTGFIVGAIAMATEHKVIHCSKAKKIGYLFTFPFFMISYIPITVIAAFRKVWWKPIEHNVGKTLDDIKKD